MLKIIAGIAGGIIARLFIENSLAKKNIGKIVSTSPPALTVCKDGHLTTAKGKGTCAYHGGSKRGIEPGEYLEFTPVRTEKTKKEKKEAKTEFAPVVPFVPSVKTQRGDGIKEVELFEKIFQPKKGLYYSAKELHELKRLLVTGINVWLSYFHDDFTSCKNTYSKYLDEKIRNNNDIFYALERSNFQKEQAIIFCKELTDPFYWIDKYNVENVSKPGYLLSIDDFPLLENSPTRQKELLTITYQDITKYFEVYKKSVFLTCEKLLRFLCNDLPRAKTFQELINNKNRPTWIYSESLDKFGKCIFGIHFRTMHPSAFLPWYEKKYGKEALQKIQFTAHSAANIVQGILNGHISVSDALEFEQFYYDKPSAPIAPVVPVVPIVPIAPVFESAIIDFSTLLKFLSKRLKFEFTAQEIKNQWESYKQHKPTIVAYLQTLKKDDLLARLMQIDQMSAYNHKNDKKESLLNYLINEYEDFFIPPTKDGYTIVTQIDFKLTNVQRVDKEVQKWSDALIQELVSSRKEKKQKYEQEEEDKKKKFANPITFEDYRLKQREIGLNDSEKLEMERLYAEQKIQTLEAEKAKKGAAQVVSNDGSIVFSYAETKHTKTGKDLFVISLESRVDKEKYIELNNRAKRLGGYYSSFKGQGAIPGFQFTTKEAANEFAQLDQVVTVEKENDVQTLLDKARHRQEQAEEELNKDRKSNTFKRAREAGSAIAHNEEELRRAKILESIALAIANNETKFLTGVNSHIILDNLISKMREAKYAYYKANEKLYPPGEKGRYQAYAEPFDLAKHKDFVVYPNTFYLDHFKSLGELLSKKKGSMNLGKTLLKIYNDNKSSRYFNAGTNLMEKLSNLDIDKNMSHGYYIKDQIEEYKRFKRANIVDRIVLSFALKELQDIALGVKVEKSQASENLKLQNFRLESGHDFDYFPTTKVVAHKLVSFLTIRPGARVLEPSAGDGELARMIREHQPAAKIDVIELQYKFREFLATQGFNVLDVRDFLEYNPADCYDVIVMNPPFSIRQDAIHVLHAFSLLCPGGQLAAIVSEGLFFAEDEHAKAFRELFSIHGQHKERLEAGAFKESGTMVNTRIVIFKK
jgi:hypothetical protein